MHVMIVDNDEAWTRSLEILLKQRGYEVAAFTQPEEACAYLDRASETPDAVVLDYVMPQMNGLELLARIAPKLKPGCAVVLVTGHADQLAATDLKRIGVSACLEKPADADQLIEALEAGAA